MAAPKLLISCVSLSKFAPAAARGLKLHHRGGIVPYDVFALAGACGLKQEPERIVAARQTSASMKTGSAAWRKPARRSKHGVRTAPQPISSALSARLSHTGGVCKNLGRGLWKRRSDAWLVGSSGAQRLAAGLHIARAGHTPPLCPMVRSLII